MAKNTRPDLTSLLQPLLGRWTLSVVYKWRECFQRSLLWPSFRLNSAPFARLWELQLSVRRGRCFSALRERTDVTDVRQLVSFGKALSLHLKCMTNYWDWCLRDAIKVRVYMVETAVSDKLSAVVTDDASSVQGRGTGFAGLLLSVLHGIIHQVGSY